MVFKKILVKDRKGVIKNVTSRLGNCKINWKKSS